MRLESVVVVWRLSAVEVVVVSVVVLVVAVHDISRVRVIVIVGKE
jgi:hypothetical protein